MPEYNHAPAPAAETPVPASIGVCVHGGDVGSKAGENGIGLENRLRQSRQRTTGMCVWRVYERVCIDDV